MSKDVDDLQFINQKLNIPVHEYKPTDIALYLADEKIISFFQNGIELGPRALGNRSFLADPRSNKMKEKMNLKIKHREGYRPFAPIVLKDYFENILSLILATILTCSRHLDVGRLLQEELLQLCM